MDKLKMHTPDMSQENIEKISKFFPQVVTEKEDDKGNIKKVIDFDALKQFLSDDLVEGEDERYRLDWPGKKASILKANTAITDKTLRPVKEGSVDFDKTENVYIEGDNFQVLKLLQESYLNKVKMIYIDPPYNTGKDFVYKDNFIQNKDEYNEEVGAVDEDGNKLFKNTATNGRFHSDWLSMMYERLVIARDLLRDDGVIFISIDDNEVANLRKIGDEIFGEENFVADFIWKSKSGGANDSNLVAVDSEYILVYCKDSSCVNFNLDKNATVTTSYNNEDEKGRYSLDRLDKQSLGYQKSLDYTIKGPNGRIYQVEHKNFENKIARWRWGKKTVEERYSELVFKWPYVYTKNYQKEGSISRNLLIEDRFGRTRTGKTEFKKLFDNISYFDFPKPPQLIKYLSEISTNKNDIILDFFSGSATTVHAVMQLNAEDGGNRKYIMVQLPEEIDEKSEAFKAGYKNICEIGKERIRRAGKKILEDNKKELEKRDTPLDIGFRVFKLDSTNLKDVYYNPNEISQDLLSTLENNIKEDRSPEDLLVQVMLDLGLELSHKIEEKEILKHKVFFIEDNSLVACFDKNINFSIVDQIAKVKPLKVVFQDACFKDDKDRINLEERFKRLSPEASIKVI